MGKLADIKDSVAIVRESAIIIVVSVVAICPGVLAYWAKTLNDQSKNQGAKSIEVDVGLAKITFDNASQQIAALTKAAEQNANVQKLAKQLETSASSPQNIQRAKEITAAANSLDAQIQTSLTTARNVQLSQDAILQDASGKATGPGQYGIVVSADKEGEQATYEVDQLRSRNYNVVLYDRQGFLRAVALFPDAAAAKQNLSTIQRYRNGAYVINISNWCPNSVPRGSLSNASVFECQ